MNRISYMIGFCWLMLLWATPALTAPTQHEVALEAFRQALQQEETTFALPLGQGLSLPLRWSESVNSFFSQGIRTYVGKWQGKETWWEILSMDKVTTSLQPAEGWWLPPCVTLPERVGCIPGRREGKPGQGRQAATWIHRHPQRRGFSRRRLSRSPLALPMELFVCFVWRCL